MRYKVFLYLDAEYDDIEADCVDEACDIAKEMAIEDDEWWYEVELVEDEDGQNR